MKEMLHACQTARFDKTWLFLFLEGQPGLFIIFAQPPGRYTKMT